MRKILKALIVLVLMFALTGCLPSPSNYTVTRNKEKSLILTVGDEVDFKEYFILTDNTTGARIEVLDSMLDLSNVNLETDGSFTVKFEYSGARLGLTFIVNKATAPTTITKIAIKSLKTDYLVGESFVNGILTVTYSDSSTIDVTLGIDLVSGFDTSSVGQKNITITYEGKTLTTTINVKDNVVFDNLQEVFNKYSQDLNFNVNYYVDYPNADFYYETDYEYDGDNMASIFIGEYYTEETFWVVEDSKNVIYYDGGNGYTRYTETDQDYEDLTYLFDLIYFENLNATEFEYDEASGYYVAKNPATTAEKIIDMYEYGTFSSFKIKIENDLIKEIIAELVHDTNYDTSEIGAKSTYILSFTKYGQISITPDRYQTTPTPEPTSLITEFTDKELSVGSGQIAYLASSKSFGYDEIRGVQFTQGNGEVTLSSKTLVNNVTTITLVVATNQDLGMQVKVTVGGENMLSNGKSVVDVPVTNYNVNTTVTFTSEKELSGVVVITLSPNAAKKSMYISKIEINGEAGGNSGVSDMMPEQKYDANTVSSERLQDKIMAADGCIGLPSIGTYNALVVPVQFSDTTVNDSDIAKLQKAFNGTSTDTGWESVSSFYKKSSYGKLNLTFDIVPTYISNNSSAYFNKNETDSDKVLIEVLNYYEDLIDLTKYDSNNDGVIDAIYIIYSAAVDYDNNDSNYWAYVTWYSGENKYDGLDAYTYLYAGFDFMDEDADSVDGFNYNGTVQGLKVNASTYIHETGHLLGLDDYYDYDTSVGANEGLGGADMMDYTVGDHNAYSKLMLGWVEPIVVTSNQTLTINPFHSSGEFIMVLLDYNNSYFSEYLIIDLYENSGLNALHANLENSYLYDGAAYGVRIYHVSNKVTSGYNTETYYSVTDYNNTSTSISLIKLIEADGGNKFSHSDGFATSADLWKAGQSFSQVYKDYTRNDKKPINFDITINSVSQENANITVTFK